MVLVAGPQATAADRCVACGVQQRPECGCPAGTHGHTCAKRDLAANGNPNVFGPGAEIAGVDVAGLTVAEAGAALESALLPQLNRPLDLRAGTVSLSIPADTLDQELSLDAMLREAEQLAAEGRPVSVPAAVAYDQPALRAELATLAAQLYRPPQLLISSTAPLSRSFVVRPARGLDLDASLALIDEHLRSFEPARRLSLPLHDLDDKPERDLARLQDEIIAMAQEWDGIVGFYLYDLASGTEVGLHEHSIFSGASIMKVPIMLGTYVSLPKLTRDQQDLLDLMIVKSDNMAANSLLAQSVGGTGTEDALTGLETLNAMLRDLGLPFTYQSLPYESGQYLIGLLGKEIYAGPLLDGPDPQTEADPYLRTTPLEMGRMLTMIVECSQGKGLLLKRYPGVLSATRCGEMIERLQRNEDQTRIVAGLPRGVSAAHKSGWVEDMQADVAYVESQGGDYVVAIYVYRKVPGGYLADEVATPAIAAFSHLVYSFYNPEPEGE
jgi:beta-lactamase class A